MLDRHSHDFDECPAAHLQAAAIKAVKQVPAETERARSLPRGLLAPHLN